MARTIIVDGLLAGFNFVVNADLATAVALFLLFFIREMIDGPTPMHIVESPEFGAGKTHLVESIIQAVFCRA